MAVPLSFRAAAGVARVADRRWGRVMLAVPGGPTVLLAPVPLFPNRPNWTARTGHGG